MTSNLLKDSLGKVLVEEGLKLNNLVVLDADLGISTTTVRFKTEFPDRFIQVGIAEQNMMGIAAGLALTGWIPVATTFACFASKRACEQVSISIAYPYLNVKIIGTYAGVSAGKTGATHQALEDIAIMRSIPNMVVVEICDETELRSALHALLKYDGPVYLRVCRENFGDVYSKDPLFKIGKADVLESGDDATIIAAGSTVIPALQARKLLKREGINVGVINSPCIKPLDERTIIEAAKRSKMIVVVENHNIIGGLGSAIAELLSEQTPIIVKRLGIGDVFGVSGSMEELFKLHGINSESIAFAVKEGLKTVNKRSGGNNIYD